ncbi:MAG TPA: hypothetical protein VGM33_18135 [Baekduia sp.]
MRFRSRGREAAIAEADGRQWLLARRGMFNPVTTAHDGAGVLVGEFAPGWWRGRPLRWDGRELRLPKLSAWRQRYGLYDGDREIAVIGGMRSSAQPVMVTIDDPAAVDPGLLLFAAFVVHWLAQGSRPDAASVSGFG